LLKIIKFLRKSWAYILLIIVLLVVQALCDLSLPGYTSDIVNVGIQQGGVEEDTPEAISEAEFQKLQLFMNDEEKKQLNSAYFRVDESVEASEYNAYKKKYKVLENSAIYVLKEDEKDLSELLEEPILAVLTFSMLDEESTLVMFSQHMDTQGMTLSQLAEAMGITVYGNEQLNIFDFIKSGVLDGVELRNSIVQQYSKAADTIISQMSIAYVKAEYEKIGMDMEKKQTNYLLYTGTKMLALALLGTIISIIVGLIASKVAAKVGCDLREGVFKRVVSFSNTEMDRFSTASLITRSTNDIQQIQMVLVLILRMVIYAPILGIGGVIKILDTDTSMAWIVGFAILVIIFIISILMVIALPKFKKMQSLVDRLNLVSREILTGLPVIRAFSRQKHEEKRFDTANINLTKVSLFTNRVMAFMMPMMMLVMNCVALLIVWVGADGVDNGKLQVGDMMAFISYSMQIIISFLMLTMISIILPRATVSANRIDEVLTTEPIIRDKENVVSLSPGNKRVINFENVSFRYPNAEEDVLTNINFTANAGETTAIIGSTGSGKSTLVQLLPRFYDVTDGRITIDGIDIRDISQHELREEIGYVPQKGILFSGDIASNLRFGNENATDEEIKIAAEIAQAANFIEEKPDKYKSSISQGGSNVSGGQRQRLAIARAIAKNPNIYVFDDSFSALDYKTDVELRRALKEKIAGATVIIVAQRINTIKNADKIIVLDDGNMVGMGTHEELLQNNEVYRQIAMSQLSEEELGIDMKGAENNV